MLHPVKINSILGLAVMLSLLVFAPQPSLANCKNSGGSSGSNKFGSQVNGGSVTICASAVSVTPARSTTLKAPARSPVKTPTKTVAKPIAKPVVKVSFHKLPIAPVIKKPQPQPKPVAKPKQPAKVVSKPSTLNKTSAAADFTPAAADGSVYPSNQLAVGQRASFVTSAVQHYRTGTLLNMPTEVRFTPVSVAWDFGDGNLVAGAYVGHAFDSTGTHPVRVRVVYAVSYRLKGSATWIAEPDTITLLDELEVDVSGNSGSGSNSNQDPPAANRVLLVGGDCLTRPTSFGCN
jgi:hypothetical protein